MPATKRSICLFLFKLSISVQFTSYVLNLSVNQIYSDNMLSQLLIVKFTFFKAFKFNQTLFVAMKFCLWNRLGKAEVLHCRVLNT